MLEVFISAIMSFIGTNIDDLFVDTLIFAGLDGEMTSGADVPERTRTKMFANRNVRAQVRSIFIGKYLGIGTLVLISLLGAFGLQLLPQKYIGFLGLVPIALGVKAWLDCLREKRADRELEEAGDIEVKYAEAERNGREMPTRTMKETSAGLLWSVALLTIANGADNIGVYIPMFAGFSLWQMGVVVCVFAVMIALWCFIAKRLADWPVLKNFLLKYKGAIVPVVFVVLGVYIMIENYLF